MGRPITGSTPMWLPLPSPIADHATTPALMTVAGLAPKECRGHKTRSAIRPGRIEPMCLSMPTARAG